MKDLTNDFIQNLNFEIKRFKKFINTIDIKKISISTISNLKIKYPYKKSINLNTISNIVIKDYETIFISPYNEKDIKLIFKYITKNNYLELDISILNKNICIKIPKITEEKRKKIINLINSELENAKINVRNIRRNFNIKTKKKFKNKIFSEDEKNRIIKKINIDTNKYIEDLNNIFKDKKINLLNL